MANEIKSLTPALAWLSQLLSFFQVEAIKIPSKYRDKITEVKKLFNDDPSGLVNTTLDFSIRSALVDYRIEVPENPNLAEILNNWLKNINKDLRGKIPTGLNSLAKEYFRERWKGSSNILIRTLWSEQEELFLPTTLFFVDGEDIVVKSSSEDGIVRLGDETYYLRNPKDSNKNIRLPQGKDEFIFVQKPFESWGIREPVPFLIKRGIFRNSKFLQLISSKGEFIVAKALEYLFVMKKGTERLAIEGQVTYDENDLKQVNQDLMNLIDRKKSEPGFPSYTTNFDTAIEHLIPDYTKAINDSIYAPIEKKILAGLGLIEIVEGISSTRREGILNPKPLVGEIEQGIEDFKTLLTDIIETIIEKNKESHPKWMNAKIEINSSPIRAFMDDKVKTMLRSIYDRGSLSKRTFVELVGDVDFDLEVEQRKKEKEDKLDDLMSAPIIQNNGQNEVPNAKNKNKETLPDRQGPEKKNFNQSIELAKKLVCKKCNYEFEIDLEANQETVECPGCNETLNLLEDVEEGKILEQAPYKTNQDLPEQLKDLPAGAKSIWRKTFNSVLESTGDEDKARQSAWRNLKIKFKKVGEDWVKKEKGELEESILSLGSKEIAEIAKLEVLGKQNKLLDKLIKQSEEEGVENANI